ncbi:MAG TPA: mechanosensitive ion channel family protein [Stellaceae bacterium]
MFADSLSHALDLLGFVLLAVSGSAVFLTVLTWRSRKSRRPVSLGASLVLFFLTSWFMLDGLLAFAPGLSDRGEEIAGKVIASLVWLSLAFTANAALKRFVWYGALVRDGRPSVPDILVDLASLGVYAAALLAISSLVFDRDITAIAATSGVVALVIGYSAQSTLAEVFAGLALNLSHPFRKGDSVQIDGVWAVIVDMGWRSVSLRTYEGNLIVLPNTKAASMRLTNMDLPDNRTRHHIPFVMDVDVPPARVREVGIRAMLEVPAVLRQPPPMILVKNFTEWGVAYEAIFWQENPNVWILRRDEVAGALWYGFHRAGLPFAVRRRDLAAPDNAAPPVPRPEPRAVAAEIFAALRRAPLFTVVPDDALAMLASSQRRLLFGVPERIVRQGDAGSSMYVILSGKVNVMLDADGAETPIATMGPGESFGHMSLMTGEPRSASVRAGGDVVLVEITKEALAPVLETYPELVEALAEQIVALKEANERFQAERQTRQDAEEPRTTAISRLAARIRSFFGGETEDIPLRASA